MISRRTLALACLIALLTAACADPVPAAGASTSDAAAGDAASGDAASGDGAVAADAPKAEVPTGAPCDPDLSTGPSPRGDLGGGFVADRLIVLYGDDSVPVQCAPAFHGATDAWRFLPCGGWSKLTGSLPPPRARIASATDPVAGALFVYGGRFRTASSGPYTVFGDLWRYDTAADTWTLLHDGKGGPAARSHGLLVARPGKDKAASSELYLYGGNASTDGLQMKPLGDVWRFDLASNAWTLVKTTGKSPPARLFHTGAITNDGKSLVTFSGGDANAFLGPFLGDAWRLDLDSGAWKALANDSPRPVPRIKSGMLAIPGQPRLLVFGGHDDGPVGNRNDLWWLDPSTGEWEMVRSGDVGIGDDPDVPNEAAKGVCDFPPDFTKVDLTSPERREAFVWGWDPATKRVWLFGGKADCGPLRDVWTLDPATLEWAAIDDTPKGWSCRRYQNPCNTLCN